MHRCNWQKEDCYTGKSPITTKHIHPVPFEGQKEPTNFGEEWVESCTLENLKNNLYISPYAGKIGSAKLNFLSHQMVHLYNLQALIICEQYQYF